MLLDIDRLVRLDPDVLRRLVDRLHAMGYGTAVLARCEDLANGMLEACRLPLIYQHLDGLGSAGVAAGLFTYRRRLPAAAVAGVLGPLVEPLAAAGVIVDDGAGGVRAGLDLIPWDQQWFFCDPLQFCDRNGNGGDAVMGPGAMSATCVALIADARGRDVLDLGCGAGTIALAAARRGGRATGSDINPRAIALARVNAAMNGVAADWAVGDGAGAAGRRFDRIVCHPPYLAGIDGGTWMHGGADGDELACDLLAGSVDALVPGGLAMMLCETPRFAGVDQQPLGRLAARLDQRADLLTWVWRGPDIAHQAAAFASLADPNLGPRYAEAVVRWHAHAQRRGIAGVHRVVAAVRRRADGDAHPPLRAQLPANGAPDGRRIERCLAQAALAAGPEARLLAARLVPAPGRWQATAADPDLSQDRCWSFLPDGAPSVAVDETTTVLFGLLATAPRVADALDMFVAQAGEDLRGPALAAIRHGLVAATLWGH